MRQRGGGAQAGPVAGGLPVDRLPGVGRVVPLLAVADRRRVADRGVEVGEERRRLLRAARAVVERDQPLAVHRGDEAGHARVGPLAVVGRRGVEVEIIRARAAGEAKHRQPGGLRPSAGSRLVFRSESHQATFTPRSCVLTARTTWPALTDDDGEQLAIFEGLDSRLQTDRGRSPAAADRVPRDTFPPGVLPHRELTSDTTPSGDGTRATSRSRRSRLTIDRER